MSGVRTQWDVEQLLVVQLGFAPRSSWIEDGEREVEPERGWKEGNELPVVLFPLLVGRKSSNTWTSSRTSR